MGKKRIRPTAICVLRRGDELLVHEGYDPVRQFGYARPLGGGIDLGETSAAAVVREIREELGAEITDIALLGVVENIFEFHGETAHEILFVYSGRFVDESLYQRDVLDGLEGDEPFPAVWRSLAELRDGPHHLVPPQLWDFL